MDTSPPPSLPDSKLLEIASKVVVLCIIVVFIVIALVLLLSIYSRFYLSSFAYEEDPAIVAWRRRRAVSGNEGPRPSRPANRRGLGVEALESLPVIVYNPKDFKDGLECSVCLSEVTQGEKARLLPKCNHGFHADCIDLWFQSHSTCPLCRNPVIIMGRSDSIRIEMGDDSGDEWSSEDEGSFHSTSEGPVPLFPTNVLVWGNQAQFSSSGLSSEGTERGGPAAGGSSSGSPSSPSSSGAIGQRGETMVIDIPSSKENCSSESPSPMGMMVGDDQVGTKSPVMTRVRSLKRLLSRGKRVVPPACSSSSSSEPATTNDVQV